MEPVFQVAIKHFQVIAGLEIHPVLRRLAENPADEAGNFSCNRAFPVDDVRYTHTGYANPASQFGLGHARFIKHFGQIFAGMNSGQTIFGNHCLLLSVVIHNFDIIGVAVFKPETDTPLFIDTDAPLPNPVTVQLFELIGRRHSQIENVNRSIKLIQAHRCTFQDFLLPPTRFSGFEKGFRFRVGKCFNHETIVNYLFTFVNSLTLARKNRYAIFAPEKDGAGIGVPTTTGAHRLNPVLCGFFVRNVSPMAGLYGVSSDTPFPVARYANLYSSATPDWRRGRQVSKTCYRRDTMSNALAFRDVTFDLRIIRNTAYITSVQLAMALGYSKTNAVTKIYNRNADEFTSEMSVTQIGSQENLQDARLFSLRGAHLVAMFARTPVAKEFRKWVLDVLDKETKADINLSDPDYIVRTRQIALQYFDDFRKAVREGKDTPTMDIPADVLAGLLAGSLWRHRFVLDVSCEGRIQISPMPDPFDTVAKIISDPGWANLEKIRQVFDACMTALSNRLGVGGTK